MAWMVGGDFLAFLHADGEAPGNPGRRHVEHALRNDLAARLPAALRSLAESEKTGSDAVCEALRAIDPRFTSYRPPGV